MFVASGDFAREEGIWPTPPAALIKTIRPDLGGNSNCIASVRQLTRENEAPPSAADQNE